MSIVTFRFFLLTAAAAADLCYLLHPTAAFCYLPHLAATFTLCYLSFPNTTCRRAALPASRGDSVRTGHTVSSVHASLPLCVSVSPLRKHTATQKKTAIVAIGPDSVSVRLCRIVSVRYGLWLPGCVGPTRCGLLCTVSESHGLEAPLASRARATTESI